MNDKYNTMLSYIEQLAAKATDTANPVNALQFSQAANNLANAIWVFPIPIQEETE